jgi:hypothetical protein
MTIYEKYLQSAKEMKPSSIGHYPTTLALSAKWRCSKGSLSLFKLFTASPERRILAYANFHYITASDAEIFQYAKNDADRFNINAIIGFGTSDYALKYLSDCYQLDPANTVNAVLLGREVNKIETEMNESFYLSSDNYNYYSKNDDKGKVKLHLDSPAILP